jgi:hypothetical protein
MDVNYILAREQVELALARAAVSPGARAAHQGLADRYRDMVDDYRQDRGAIRPLSAPRAV